MSIGYIDTVRAACLLLTQYGEEAKNHAHDMLARFTWQQDVQGAGAWLAILHDMEMLTDTTRQGGRLH